MLINYKIKMIKVINNLILGWFTLTVGWFKLFSGKFQNGGEKILSGALTKIKRKSNTFEVGVSNTETDSFSSLYLPK